MRPLPSFALGSALAGWRWVVPGTLPDHWNAAGPKCMEVADWQVQEYNENLYMMRQSGCLDYEKPFLYLIFGKDRALLIDTGSRNFRSRRWWMKSLADGLSARSGRAFRWWSRTHTHIPTTPLEMSK